MIDIYISSINSNERIIEQPSNMDFELITAGYAVVEEGDTFVNRPNGLPNYQLLYIKEGCGHFEINGQKTVIHEKSAIIFHPGEPQVYRYFKIDHPKMFWVHVGGDGVERLLSELGIFDERIFSVKNDTKLVEYLRTAAEETVELKKGYKQASIACATQAFICLARDEGISRQSSHKEIVEHMVSKIRREYAIDVPNSEYASEVNMSTSNFLRVFKEETGMSPHSFKVSVRIAAAKDMLINTSYRIGTIAQSVGFNDPMYFSKCFRKLTGETPGEFRKKNTVVNFNK